jgi:glucose/arabinose dehydrogenase
MKTTTTIAVLAGFGAAVLAALAFPHAQGPAAAPAQILTVPPGFRSGAGRGPSARRPPIVADFDEQGRSTSPTRRVSNDKVEKQLPRKPHRIVRLEDKNGDGRFDTSVVFADRMMFPEGAMWFDGSLYVAAPPSIWKLTDTDGDGVPIDAKSGFTEDADGMRERSARAYLGPDGWIYWTKGAFAEQTYERPASAAGDESRAHLPPASRRRRVEPVMTGGMDNPVDVAFTAARRSGCSPRRSRATATRPPRRADSRRLRRPVWQAARGHRWSHAHRRSDARDQRVGAGGPGRFDAL